MQWANHSYSAQRTSAVKEYFLAVCIIDVHNHLRQEGLAIEVAVATNDWWFRMFYTVSDREAVQMEEEEDCVDINTHEVIPVAEWKAQVISKARRL